MMETLPRKTLINQIKKTIEIANDRSHDDLINSLSDLLVLVERYAEEKGIKVICGNTDIDELFLPYLRIYSNKRMLMLGMFGPDTSIFDVYRMFELHKYMSEFLISTIPMNEFKNHLVFYCIPLVSCYSVLKVFDQRV